MWLAKQHSQDFTQDFKTSEFVLWVAIEDWEEECKYFIQLIQCYTKSEPCIQTSDSITDLKPRTWNPFSLLGTFYLLLSAQGRGGKRTDHISIKYCNTQTIISQTLLFVCHFLLRSSWLCSVTGALRSSFTFSPLPLLKCPPVGCSHPTAHHTCSCEAHHRGREHNSSWPSGLKCIAQSCCTDWQPPSQHLILLSSLHVPFVRSWQELLALSCSTRNKTQHNP